MEQAALVPLTYFKVLLYRSAARHQPGVHGRLQRSVRLPQHRHHRRSQPRKAGEGIGARGLRHGPRAPAPVPVISYIIRRTDRGSDPAAGRHRGHLRHLLPAAEAGRADRRPARAAVHRQEPHARGHRGGQARTSAWTSPSTSSTGTSSRGSSPAPPTTSAPPRSTATRPCFGYSFKDHVEVWPQLTDRLPVTLSLAVGAAVHLAAVRCRGRCDLRAQAGLVLRPRRPWASPWPASRCRSSSPASWRCCSSPTSWRSSGSTYVRFTENPAQWANTLFLPGVRSRCCTPRIYARLTRSGMLETMNEDYIRTARAKGLRERTVVGRHGLRAALTPIVTVFGMDVGLLLGGAVITETVFSLHGIGEYAVQAHHRQRPAHDPRRDPARRVLRRVLQSPGGPAVRRHRPAGEALVTELSKTGAAVGEPVAAGPAEPPDRLPRSARPQGALPDRRRPGQVRRRAVASSWRRAGPSASWASPAPASP